MNPNRSCLFLLLLAGTSACRLQLNGRVVGGHATGPTTGATTATGPTTTHAEFQPTGGTRERPFDDRQYQACIAAFEANYDKWLPADKAAKAALAKVKGESPYVAVPVLMRALEQLDTQAAPRQTGAMPAGAVYAPATRLELASALVQLAAATHSFSCVNDQHRIEVDDEYLPPLVGDREQDKVRLCGGPTPAARATWLEARKTAADAFNTANSKVHDDRAYKGTWSKVLAFSSNSKEATLALTTMSGDRRCVPNGRYGAQPDGSWGPLCDYEELPSFAVGDKHGYHFAPQTLPFALKRGDEITLKYELDPDAPAGNEPVARKGGYWWLTSVTRGKTTIFENCATSAAHQAEVQNVLRPLFVISRRD